ncbi:helix-turn-helix transcriptional regulator [Streptomyces sp. NPDC050617]|uniref:helix-turn-helix domain-containing protein n=1 Tax=Streptomyces sp. NPDC050617 TaxID=3154628 RepID=UPI003443C175
MGSAGERLKTTRKLRDLTQSDLARASGVSKSVITKLEQGERDGARLETWRKLAHALRVPTMYLAGDQDGDGADARTEDRWAAVRAAVAAPPVAAEGEDLPTVGGVTDALKAAQPLFKSDAFAALAVVAPALVRDADALGPEGRAVRVRTLQLVGWLLTQTRQFAAAEVALTRALDDAGDRLQAAATVNTLCWLRLRQGRLGEARELATHWADETEPRISRATPTELSTWGWMLLRVSAAAVRDNAPGEAEDALRFARSAAVAVGREYAPENDRLRTFGPVTVALKRAENAAVVDRPDVVLRLAERVPTGGLRPTSNNRNRHYLDVADAYAKTRNYSAAVERLMIIRDGSPEWLPQQRFARDIMKRLVQGRRTLTPEMRELAGVVGLAM